MLRPALLTSLIISSLMIFASQAFADGFRGGAKQRVQYLMDIEVKDQASWDRVSETECDRSESHGEQLIESSSYLPAASPVTSRGKGNYVSFTLFGNRSWQLSGFARKDSSTYENIWQPATLTVNNQDSSQDKGCPSDPVVICPDCEASTPPPQVCGTYKGSITFSGLTSNFGPGRTNTALLMADPEIDDPFYKEDGSSYCNNGALTPWPGLMALDESQGQFELSRSKAFSYFALSGKDQKACRTLEPEFARSPEAQKKLNRCKANFEIKIKKLKTESTPAPDFFEARQESIVTLRFYFRGMCVKNRCRFKDSGWKPKSSMPGNPYRWG